MKSRLLRTLSLLFLGGVLGLTAAPAAFQAVGVKAEEEIVKKGSQEFGSSAVSGWTCTNQKSYCGLYYGGKLNSASIKNPSISDFSVLSDGEAYTISVNVYGICNYSATGYKNTVNVSTLNSSENLVSQGVAVADGLNKGSAASSAKTPCNFKFASTATTTGLQIDIGAYCCLVKVEWTISKGGETPTPPAGGDSYTLVEDASSLSTGDIIVIGNANAGSIAGAFEKKYLKSESAVFNFEDKTVTSTLANEITLLESSDSFKFLTSSGQITATENGAISITDNGTLWNISIIEGATSITCETGYFTYNNSENSRFTYYTSAQAGVEIYKKATKADKLSVTYNANGGSGEVVDSNSPYTVGDTVTVLESSLTAPEGKVFKEWNTLSDGKGTSYAPGATFTITNNVILYAMWKDNIVEKGNYYSLVTNFSELTAGSVILLAMPDSDNLIVNGGFNSDYECLYECSYRYEDNKIFIPSSDENAHPLKLGVENSLFTFEYSDGNYLGAYKEPNNSLSLSKTKKSTKYHWSISMDGYNATILNEDESYGYLKHGSSRFSNYKSTSGGTFNPYIFKREGVINEVSIDPEEQSVFVNGKATLNATWNKELTPSKFAWSVEQEEEFIRLDEDVSSNELIIYGIKEGTATVKLMVDDDSTLTAECVVTVKPASESILEEGSYFIVNGGNSHLMSASILDDTTIDLTNLSNQWTVEYANKGDNTYYISNNTNYLTRKRSIAGSGTETELALSPTKYDYWTLSGDKTNGFYALCSSKNSKDLYLGPGDDGKWRAISTKGIIRFVDGLEFDSITYEDDGTSIKTFNVGDEFDPKGLTFYGTYKGSSEKYLIPSSIAKTIVWDKITAGTTATGHLFYAGANRTITVTGLTITNYQPVSIELSGEYVTEYQVGESVNTAGMIVTLNLEDGAEHKSEVLKEDEYVVSPQIIDSDTSQIKVSYEKDTSIFATFDITKVANKYVVANHIAVGDKIVIGKLDEKSDGSNIAGGAELYYGAEGFAQSEFGHSPKGITPYTVEEGLYADTFALKDSSGRYLRGKQESFDIKDETTYIIGNKDGSNCYTFIYPVTADNGQIYNVKFTQSSPGSEDYTLYIPTTTGCPFVDMSEGDVILSEGIGLYDFKIWVDDNEENVVHAEGELEYIENGNEIKVVDPNGSGSDGITDNACWYIEYNRNTTQWSLENYKYKKDGYYCQYNSAAKVGFKFYNSAVGEPIAIYRDNTLPLNSECTGITLNTELVKKTYEVNETFSWTQSLGVTAIYSGSTQTVPVGGYDISIPDMSTKGTKTVTVSYGQIGKQKTASFTIEVTDPTPVEPTLVGVELTKAPEKSLYSENEPIDLTGIIITYKYSDGSSVTVTEENIEEYMKNMTPETSGSGGATRTIRINLKGGGDLYVQFQITVTAKPVTYDKLELAPTKTTYDYGETYQYEGKAYAVYSNGSKVEVTPILAQAVDTSVVGEQEVTLKYTIEGVTHEATYTITVVKEAKAVSATISGQKLNFVEGEEFSKGDMVVTVTFDDGTPRTNVPYQVDSSKYNKDEIGTYEIVVTVSGLSEPVKYEVTVSEAPINEIVLSHDGSKEDAEPGEYQILHFNKPFNSRNGETFDMSKFTFTSSDPSVAVVEILDDGMAYVHYLDYGYCTITVEAKVGAGKDTYKVAVLKHVESIQLNTESQDIFIGDEFALEATFNPTDSTDQRITWSSSDTSIATVDENGVVTGLKEGTVTITATPKDQLNAPEGGKIYATCTITVKKIPVESVTLDKTSEEVHVGDSFNIKATVSPTNATYKDVTWTSTNTDVATVDSSGKVTAVGIGTAKIVCTTVDGGKIAICNVTVNKVDVTGVSLNKESTSLAVGNTETLTATVSPTNATIKDVTWASSNTAVATVDSNGKVTAIGVGTATITVTTKDGQKTDTCEVTVSAIKVESVSLNETNVTIEINGSYNLVATINPSNAGNKNVTWTSTNTDVATVDSSGKVTAVGVGTAKIVCTTVDGGKIAICNVTVNKVDVTGVSINKESTSLVVGNTETLTATVSPTNATIKDVTWTSSNTAVATVDSNGKVTAIGVGTATITVTTKDGQKTDTCEVTVSAIKVESVSLNETNVTIEINGSYNLVATINPSNAGNKNVTWTSSNEGAATVDANGKVTAVGVGTTTITVTTADGGKTATCVVTVSNESHPVESINVDISYQEIEINGEFNITPTINPSNADNKNVTWSSSDATIATVDENGHVKGLKEGQVTITVTTVDGGKTATCVVKVNKAQSDNKQNIIILAATGGSVVVAGVGCGVGIPLGIKSRKARKLAKLGSKNK